MSDICESCSMPNHLPISCLQSLRILSVQLSEKLLAQSQSLKYYSEGSQNLTQPPRIQDPYKNIIHINACCDACYDLPLPGTRYKCKTCVNYDLCFRCLNITPHEHKDFFAITSPNLHKYKNCSTCFGRIADIVYKCPTCPAELCHECKLLNGHEHSDLQEILPFDIKVETFCNRANNRYRNGDEIQIQFVIYNNSTQFIDKIIIQCEDIPFTSINREVKVELGENEITILKVAGYINSAARTYNSRFKIVETTLNEIIASDIFIKLTVIEGLFSSFFSS